MTKYKINPGLASLMVVASIFAGWQTLLIVTALLLLFCDLDEKVKGVMIRVLTFYAAYTLVSWGWDLIYKLVDVVFNSINGIVNTINSWLEYGSQIDLSKLNLYFVNPIQSVMKIADDVISFLLLFARCGFVVAVLMNKPAKETPISKKISEFVTSITNYVSANDSAAAPTAPTAPVAEQNTNAQ